MRMFGRRLFIAVAFASLLAAAGMGGVWAAPSGQAQQTPIELLVAVLTDAGEKDALMDGELDLLSDWLIADRIAPSAGEMADGARARLSAQGQDSLGLLIAAVEDAHARGALSDGESGLLSDWLIENAIAPRTGETAAEVRKRLTALDPTPTATTTPEPVSPSLRHIAEKRYMLELINSEREKAELGSVVLGDNAAAQLHAEAALENCFASHWGIDGLKPYMRYSLAGGYQSNGENGLGIDYCIKASDGYAALGSIESEIRKAMDSWMGSAGHRRNILRKWHKKVNIGIAWNRYNFAAYQHFEGDYVEYDELPSISGDGVLTIQGATKNGAGFSQNRGLGVQIYYDSPTHALTRGQVTRTYCYDNGRQIASLRWPLTGSYYWPDSSYSATHRRCPDPYDVSADAPGPRSVEESQRFWQEAYALSQSLLPIPITAAWITAQEWTVSGGGFSVRADISSLLAEHGNGVYTVMVWGNIGDERAVISQYSMFYGVTPPGTYY